MCLSQREAVKRKVKIIGNFRILVKGNECVAGSITLNHSGTQTTGAAQLVWRGKEGLN